MITVRLTWTGGTAPQVDIVTYPDGTGVAEGVSYFPDGAECRVEVAP